MNEKTVNRLLLSMAAITMILMAATAYLAHKVALYKTSFDAYVQQDQQIKVLQATQEILGNVRFSPATAQRLNALGYRVVVLTDSTGQQQ